MTQLGQQLLPLPFYWYELFIFLQNGHKDILEVKLLDVDTQ